MSSNNSQEDVSGNSNRGVLVVTQYPNLRILYQEEFHDEFGSKGHPVFIAENGLEASARLKEPQSNISVVVMGSRRLEGIGHLIDTIERLDGSAPKIVINTSYSPDIVRGQYDNTPLAERKLIVNYVPRSNNLRELFHAVHTAMNSATTQ